VFAVVGGVNWISFLPAAVLVSLVPGANQLLSLQNAMRQGTFDASVALAGRFAAFAVMVVGVAAGLGTLLANSPAAWTAIRWLGVAYLTWLGVVTLWRSRHPADDEPRAAEQHEQPRDQWTLVRQEFIVAITNPKAVLLFAAFLPQFIEGNDRAAVVQLLIVGFSYIAIEATTAMAYTVSGGYISALHSTKRSRRVIDVLTAGSFLTLAIFLGLG